MAGEGSAGGASGRPVSGVDGAVRGFASFGGGAAPWPSGGEESRSSCPALLQAACQAVSWRPVRCAGEASGAGPAGRGRAGAGAARWARASCFSTRNKVGRPKSSRGPADLQRARGGSWWSTVGSDEDDPGGCGRLLPILRTAVGRGLRGSLVGRRGVRPRAGSGEAIFGLPRRRFEGLPEGFRRCVFDGAAARGGLHRFGKTRVFRARRRRPGKVVSLRSTTFSRAPPGCGCGGGNDPPSLSLLSARAARDFLAGGPFLSSFAPFFEPWRGARNPNFNPSSERVLTLTRAPLPREP